MVDNESFKSTNLSTFVLNVVFVFCFIGNCNPAIKDIESNNSIHFQVIPTTGATSSVNTSVCTVNNLSNGARLLSSNNSVLTLTPTPSSSSQTSTTTTASTTALGKSPSSAELNFNQTADNQINVTTNHNNSTLVANTNHTRNSTMDNTQTNTLHHSNIVNHVRTATTAAHHLVNAPIVTSTPPLVLSLSQVGDYCFI